MAGGPGFRLGVHHNEYLADGERTISAIVTVVAGGEAPRPAGMEAAEVLIVDCSSSMRWPMAKIVAARRATMAAIDVLRDGVHFGVVKGTATAELIYPPTGTLVPATPETRRAAKAAVQRLVAEGGTAMGQWLDMAGSLFDHSPGAIRHALLLTDGKNESETSTDLNQVLDACEGRFVCDARGIGEEWVVEELTRIVTVLRGRADSVVDESLLADDFRQLIAAAMDKVLPDVRLRIGTMPFSKLEAIKQVYPSEYDLTDRCVPVDAGLELVTGSWAAGESRAYQVSFELDPGLDVRYEEPRLVGWLGLAAEDGTGAAGEPAAVTATWTRDPVRPTLVDPTSRHYDHHAELGQALAEGSDAYLAGDLELAGREWGRAVRLATELGNDVVLARLRQAVEIVHAASGQVQVRPGLDRSVLLNLLISRHSQVLEAPRGAEEQPPAAGPPRRCPECAENSPAGARFCRGCGHALDAEPTP